MSRTFGSDPEFLIVDTNDQPVSAIEVVKADPEHRIKKQGHEFYYDNVLAECAVKPGDSKQQVLDNIQECLQLYADIVRPYRLKPQASVHFSRKQLDNEEAQKVNCSKDSCAYEMCIQDGPTDAIKTGTLRSAGGHVHIGCETLLGGGPEPFLAVYMMDLLMAVPSVWIDKDPTSVTRRALYGQAGRYRTKDYGLEYRSLGNFWLSSPFMTGLIYDLANHAIDLVENNKAWELWSFDLDRFDEEGTLSDSWECTYNQNTLMHGVLNGDKQELAPIFEISKKYMSKGLRKDVEKAIRKETGNFYENWSIR